MDTKYVPPHKRGRYHHHHSRRQPASVLPSKFLLGGNINDPLNLNGLGPSDNANTPKSSPMPTPHRIGEVPSLTPKNSLGLKGGTPEAITEPVVGTGPSAAVINSAKQRRRRQRRRSLRTRNDSECSTGGEEKVDGQSNDEGEGGATTAIQPERYPQKHEDTSNDRNFAGEEDTKEELLDRSQEVAAIEKSQSPDQSASALPVEPATVADSTTKEEQDVEEKKRNGEVDHEPNEISERDPEAEATGENSGTESGSRRGCTSEYVPLSSGHQPSPFVLQDEGLTSDEMITFPFESPSLSRFFNSQHMMTEPFSPPTNDMYLNAHTRRFPAGHYDYQVYQCVGPGPGPGHPHGPHPHPSAPGSSTSSDRKGSAMFQKHPRPFWHRKRIRHSRSDPIVSPVIPQPGMKRSRHYHHHSGNNQSQAKGSAAKGETTTATGELATASTAVGEKEGRERRHSSTDHQHQQQSNNKKEDSKPVKQEQKTTKTFHPKNEVFQYGNYNRYYGYRNSLTDGSDLRLRMIKREWIEGLDILDIGCNVGHVTLSLARDFKPKRIVGIDIDGHLITTARKNIKHYVPHDPTDVTVQFPQYLPVIYGALQPCPQLQQGGSSPDKMTGGGVPFPYNVVFREENYVLDEDSDLEFVQPEYDTILCLSITKWIHLNFGDSGMKRFFRRAFKHLRPGGKFILEPQQWSSYQKKKKLTEKIFQTFKEIQFFPDQFQDFLLKEIGYESVEVVGTLMHQAKGFQRPLVVFTKPVAVPARTPSKTPTSTATSAATTPAQPPSASKGSTS